MELLPLIERWVHFLAGITWIGLLYYFNLVQAPAMAAANADMGGPGGAGITKYVLPRALLWFRWAALVTWLAGAALLGERFVSAFTLQGDDAVIGIGAWLGTIIGAILSLPLAFFGAKSITSPLVSNVIRQVL
ncbi:MAG: urate hydroxylase PuuD, partial [Gammaproteobacteria bacterium]